MPAPRETRDERIARLGYEYKTLRNAAAAKIRESDAVMVELLQLQTEKEIKGLVFEDFELDLTKVEKFNEYLDEVGLRKSLPTRIWNRISVRTLAPDKLATALEDGILEATAVDEFMTKTPQKPYIVVTVRALPKSAAS